jgi:tetratricopeptide (TPR) repeat protein
VAVTSRCKGDHASTLRGAILRGVLALFFLLLNSGVVSLGESHEALQRAADLVQQGRLVEADQQAQLALSDPQTRAVAFSVLGTIRFQQKRLNESASFFRQAIQLNPRLLGAHLSLAEVYTIQGKTERAQVLFRQALTLDPSNVVARLALARTEAEKGNYQSSLDLANPILPALKHSPDGLLVLAADFAKLGERELLANLASDWARLDNAAPEWSIKFALLLANGGAIPEAITILERTRQASSPSYELAFNLAGAYALNKDFGRALDSYDEALSFNSEALQALRQAASIAERRGELERSLSYWIRAKKIEPENPEILLGFGRVCLKMDLLEDAEPALAKAASMRPNEPSYQYTLASAKVGKKQFEAAQQLLDKLVQKQPNDMQLQYALGSVLYLQGHLPEAAAHLEESVRLQPKQFASYYYLALIARDQGKDADALQRLGKLLQEYPEHGPSNQVLGELLMSAQRYPEAERALRKAVSLDPKSVKANYQLGLLLARMGRKEEADKQLAMAKTLRTEDETNSRLQLRLLDPDK